MILQPLGHLDHWGSSSLMMRAKDTPVPQLLSPSSHSQPLGFTFKVWAFQITLHLPLFTALAKCLALSVSCLSLGNITAYPCVPSISSLHWLITGF